MEQVFNVCTFRQHLSRDIYIARSVEMTIKVEEYNKWKQYLEDAVKLNSSLEPFGSLWKAQCAQIKKKMNSAILNA